jgi:uracil-DNA glycosylase family 4
MSNPGAPDLDHRRRELAALLAGFRTHFEARARSGLLGVPAVAREAPRAPAPAGAASAPTAASVPTAASAPERRGGQVGLKLVREELGECTRCKLAPGRKQIVFGVGNPEADLVFVGEAPGADEDEQGEPFVGAAGQLLTRMIAAMGFSRADVYICNVIKCRPPYNRNPEPDEVAACEPFLKKQLAAIRPRMIVALGKFAAQCLLRSDAPISRLRGRFQTYEGIPLMPTFHPAFLLRNPDAKREVWADLKMVMAELDRLGIVRKTT